MSGKLAVVIGRAASASDAELEAINGGDVGVEQELEAERVKLLHVDANLAGGGQVVGFLCSPYHQFRAFKARICQAYGSHFFWLVVAQYGLSQGAGGSLRHFAADFFYKDVKGLEPSDMQTAEAVAHIPWDVKPLYGILSDTIPIFGLKRTYYVILGGTLGSIGQLLLAIHGRALSVAVAVALFASANLSVALPDVMVDAVVAERSRTQTELSADLQSLCWGSLALFEIVASCFKGPLLEQFGPQVLLAGASLAPLAITLLAWRGSRREQRVSNHTQDGCTSCFARLRANLRLFFLTIRMPKVLRPTIFIFLRKAVVPSMSGPMFFFLTSEAEGYPHFGPRFLGVLSAVGSVCALLAIVFYNRYFRDVQLRRIFVAFGVVQFLSGLSDLILVLRWNQRLGISDTVFALGDDVLFATLEKALSMPINVLMARLCPMTIEATFFALLASLSNSSHDIAKYLGALLARALGISKSNLDDLWKAILVRQLCKLLPIVLPLLLLPDASPLKHSFLPDDLPVELHTGGADANASSGRPTDGDADADAEQDPSAS